MNDFLDGMLKEDPKPAASGEPPAATSETQPPPAAQPGASGEPAPAGDPAKPASPEPGYVPLAALLDDREKRQKAQAEADELKAQIKKLTEKRVPPPSYQDDPDAWARSLEQRTYEIKRDTKFEQSEMFAVDKYGSELVEAAKAWSEEKAKSEAAQYGYSPLVTMIHHQRHPLDWVVKEYQQAKWLAEVGNDRDAWVKKRYSELSASTDPNAPPANNAGGSPQPGTPPSAKPPFVPPKSLVNAPSAGGMTKGTPIGGGVAFDAVFPN
jgi:hypothetical protein